MATTEENNLEILLFRVAALPDVDGVVWRRDVVTDGAFVARTSVQSWFARRASSSARTGAIASAAGASNT